MALLKSILSRLAGRMRRLGWTLQVLKFFPQSIIGFKTTTLNFLVTSKAEIRVFTPVLNEILKHPGLSANVIYLSSFRFAFKDEGNFEQSHNVHLTRSIIPIVRSCLAPINAANVICLDHELHGHQHAVGLGLIRYINSAGGKSVCLQHGGITTKNIAGQKTSASTYQVLWGSRMVDQLRESGNFENDKIFLTGNPLHDVLQSIQAEDILRLLGTFEVAPRESGVPRRILLLATCLHDEYEDRENPEEVYRRYISAIYESIDFSSNKLVVKMHPMDQVTPNIYEQQLDDKYRHHVTIIPPSGDISFYELASVADVVLTRASTTAEEALMMGKKVLALDLFTDGPSRQLEYLTAVNGFKVVCDPTDFPGAIKGICESPTPDDEQIEKLTEELTWRLDGKSAQRVVGVLKEIASRKHG